MIKIILIAITLFALTPASEESIIIPVPVEVVKVSGHFKLNSKTKIVLVSTEARLSAHFLNDYFQKHYGFKLNIIENKTKNNVNSISLGIDKINGAANNSYILKSSENGVIIRGTSDTSIFYGVQSLIQLLPVKKDKTLLIPSVIIKDHPRFSYRGMHLDVSRHFSSVDFIKKYIDLLALHKMNVFHWHLTEDQGWRIEIKKYPRLTTIGGYRNGTITGRYPGNGNTDVRYGGYYTQEQIKEIIRYAADRYITIIPEIEMPGHSSAAIAAYPELSCFPNENTEVAAGTTWAGERTGKQVQQAWGVFDDVFCPTEYTFDFLENVLDEVMSLFPGKYIHIGGDECPKNNWKRSAFCQDLIKEKGLKDEHGLQSYFIQRIEKYVNSKGKKIIGWDEILEGGLAPNATVMSWQGEAGGIAAAKQKHDVIMSPGAWLYFDHSQTKQEDSLVIGGYNSLQKVYSYEPIPKELSKQEAKHILGAQANVWTEYMTNPAKIEYMILPRMSALSEVLWSPPSKRNWPDFENRMTQQFERYQLWKVNYSKASLKSTDN